MSARSLTGYVSSELGNGKEEASYALLYIIKGPCKPYKQIVARYSTGTGTTGSRL